MKLHLPLEPGTIITSLGARSLVGQTTTFVAPDSTRYEAEILEADVDEDGALELTIDVDVDDLERIFG